MEMLEIAILWACDWMAFGVLNIVTVEDIEFLLLCGPFFLLALNTPRNTLQYDEPLEASSER